MDEVKGQHQQDNYKGDPYGDLSFDSGQKNSSITIIATHVFKVIALKSFYELLSSILISTSIIQEKQGTTPCLKFTMYHTSTLMSTSNEISSNIPKGSVTTMNCYIQKEDLVP